LGDMSRVRTGRTYGLVYYTIANLLTQDDQVRCFETAARHLTDHGVFVLECGVCRPLHHDPVTQILDENHVRIGADGVVFNPIRLRLAHPPEFDLMARIADLRLRERWGGWNGESYIAGSWRHVSVYERAVP
jgi:hypothetical protein